MDLRVRARVLPGRCSWSPRSSSLSSADAAADHRPPPPRAEESGRRYGGNVRRTAEQPRSPDLDRCDRRRTEAINGAVYGEPLIYDGRVYVENESDVVYALDARSGRVAWKRRVGEPCSTTCVR